MSKMESVVKSVVSRFISKQIECIPPSRLEKIRKDYEALPKHPTGKAVPQWQKKTKMAGMNGVGTS